MRRQLIRADKPESLDLLINIIGSFMWWKDLRVENSLESLETSCKSLFSWDGEHTYIAEPGETVSKMPYLQLIQLTFT